MKSISKLLTALITILFLGLSHPAKAQEMDGNRMKRDIKIMENVLQEIFKTKMHSSRGHVGVAAFSFGTGNDIRGTHLPDYGVIFSIPGIQRRFITISNNDSTNSYSYTFAYSDTMDEDREVTKESVIARIKDFLTEYGSTIGQLEDDDKIMVIYNSNKQHRAVAFLGSSGKEKMPEKLPTISVVIKKSALKDYRTGKISKSDLDERFSVSMAEDDRNKHLDLKVMANIFETALQSDNEERFRIRGDVDYLKLDNFGAVFSMRVSYQNAPFLGKAFQLQAMNTIRLELTNHSGDSAAAAKAKERVQQVKKEQQERIEAEKEAYSTLLSSMKEYLVDYGRTLTSIPSDQHLLVSMTLSSRVDDIPERVDFQINKSVLLDMDKGTISREQAMNRIALREY